MVTVSELLSGLKRVEKSSDGWTALCPAHEDREPSLSVNEKDSKILLYCHAGCTVDSICAALSIKVADLFTANGNGNSARRMICAYDYTDENGNLLYQNCRYDPKGFRQRKPNGSGWTYNLGGIRRVPYHLPEIIRADFVLMVEGEKDSDRATSLGFTSTSSKNWRPEFAEFVRGKNAVIIADADDAGRKIADDAARMLAGKVASLKLFELPGSAKDLSEWVDAGGTRAALEGYIELLPEWTPRVIGWRDLFHTYEEAVDAPPLRFSVEKFLQRDAATILAGLSGQYKTWLMLSIVKAQLEGTGKLWNLFNVLERSKRVLYLIPESSLGPFVYRLNKLGLLPYVKEDRLLIRTLSKGPAPKLQDARILEAAKGADIYLDTAVRFIEGDESSASDNNRGLAADIFALQAAGASIEEKP